MTESVILGEAELPPGLAGAAFTLAGFMPPPGIKWCWEKVWERLLSSHFPCPGCSLMQVWLSELQIWLLQNLWIQLGKPTPPIPLPVATLKDMPVGHAAKAIYSQNKAGPGVAVPGLAPFWMERLLECGCLAVLFCALTYVPTGQVWAKAESGLMAHKANVS